MLKDELKSAAEAVSSHPKTSSLLTGVIAWVNAHWVDWGQPIVNALTSIAGLILIVILIKKHYTEEKLAKKKLAEKDKDD